MTVNNWYFTIIKIFTNDSEDDDATHLNIAESS